ncbi:SpoIIE family protein phosphatase [Streptomyces sp. NBC_01622]|uniref:ATP-binding SpoIIE family protein phosphatase n=1 Tax=Streptomyces sp. NBC_01622 TaxID=2975903 RepID=UPI0038698AE0|nr:SpoIIE family protein phosphatase [Streptomyces sp. NBC_01622]
MGSERTEWWGATGDQAGPFDAGTATLSAQGIITGWSEGAQLLLGYLAAEVVGHTAAGLFAEAAFPDTAWCSMAGTREWSGTAALRHRDGHRVDLALGIRRRMEDDGRPQEYLVTAVPHSDGPAYDWPTMLDWAFAQSTVAMTVFDRELRHPRMNEAASEEWGTAEVGIGSELRRRICEVAELGIPMRHEVCADEESADRGSASVVEMWPVRDPVRGEVRGVGAVSLDTSEQHRARQRLALLNEAGSRIGTTLDAASTARELAALVVPRLADFVSVDLLDDVLRGDEPVASAMVLRRIAHETTDETADAPAAEAAVRLGEIVAYPPSSPPARSLATGQPLLARGEDAEFSRWMARHDIRSVMAVALRAREVTLGVAVFGRRRTAPFDQTDLLLAEELAGRAAVSVDNARRYTRERRTALALQRSLLPRRLPEQAAVKAAFRYLPAGSQAGVGGDWFDVVPLSGTRVALVVGDVVGHGIHASATMGRLRTAVRTLADVDLPPDELLTHLDDLVTHVTADETGSAHNAPDSGESSATCLYAVYDPVSLTCTLASAGHPPPVILLPDGTVSLVRLSPGPPLGVGGLPFEATEVELPEGSLLALYTDGLIEARGQELGIGMELLCKALAGPAPSLEATCDNVLKALLPDRPPDDVALLLARTRALHTDQVATWALPANPAIVAVARSQVSRQLTNWGLADMSFVTELLVSELVTNAIRYGSAPIGLRLIRDRTLICEVSDANSAAPHLRRARDFDEGGRGLHMVAQLAQGWGTRQTALGKTIWAKQTLSVS